MKIITALVPAAVLLGIMYFTNLYTAEESVHILLVVFIGSVLTLLIIFLINRRNGK